jgi:hypothetical protein
MASSLEKAGFSRSDTVLWNVVPYCVSTANENRNATTAQIVQALPFTQLFIDCLTKLRVVVFCGRRAQRSKNYLKFPESVSQLCTFHTGAMAFNHARCREDIELTFNKAYQIISTG